MSSAGAASAPPEPQQPRWVRRLTIANIVFIGLSALFGLLALAGVNQIVIALFFFPQIPFTISWPVVGGGIIVAALVTSAVFALIGGERAERGRRFYASLTLCGFVVNCLSFVAPLMIVAIAQAG